MWKLSTRKKQQMTKDRAINIVDGLELNPLPAETKEAWQMLIDCGDIWQMSQWKQNAAISLIQSRLLKPSPAMERVINNQNMPTQRDPFADFHPMGGMAPGYIPPAFDSVTGRLIGQPSLADATNSPEGSARQYLADLSKAYGEKHGR